MIGGVEPNGLCGAGVNYAEQFPNADKSQPEHYGIFTRICCTSGGKRTEDEQVSRCPKWIRRTRKQGEQRADKIEKCLSNMRIAMTVVNEWKTWTKKNRVAKQEVVECPVCKGKLHLSQAAYNGHVWGKCETEDCVSWMQ